MPPRRTPRRNDGLSRDRINRRQFLTQAGLIAAGGPALLAACTRQPSGSASVKGAQQLQLASPSNPVTWPINKGNEAIPSGQPIPSGRTLEVYTYDAYWSTDGPSSAKAKFEQKYGVKINITTFNDLDEALTKIRQGNNNFDVWIGSGYDLTSRLVSTSLIRPLNHSYLPNLANVWDYFQNPWYDQGARYTVPYTVYTSGLGWRTDMLKSADPSTLPNPWSSLWNTAETGNVAVWDDYRSTIEMALLSAGITDVNTDRASDLDKASLQLTSLIKATNPRVTIQMWEDMPAKKYGLATMWSGDVINAAWGSGADVAKYRYWYAKDGSGMVDNDLLVILSGGKEPVLAHAFLDWMLAPANAYKNFNASGYQMPQRTFPIEQIISENSFPKELESVFLKDTEIGKGYPALELSTDNQAAWHSIWLAFKAGK